MIFTVLQIKIMQNLKKFTFFLLPVVLIIAGCNILEKTPLSHQEIEQIVQKEYPLQTDAELDYLLIPPNAFKPQKNYPLFVFMHGLQSCATCVLQANYELFTRQNFYILIPQAPERVKKGYSWYNRRGKSFLKDLERSETAIVSLVEHVIKKRRIDVGTIVLSGFSQGGRLTYYIGLKNPSLFSELVPIGGVFMEEQLQSYLVDARGDFKISIKHGQDDDIHPVDNAKQAYELLELMGFDVTLDVYPVKHTYTDDMLLGVFHPLNEKN